MSAKMFLDTIKTLEIQNIDDETLTGIAKSLEMVIDMSTFETEIQREAFVKLTEIQETMGKRAANIQAKADAFWKSEVERITSKAKAKAKAKIRKSIKKQLDDDEIAPGSTEDDTLTRLKIRSEEDGTLSFEFRGIRWDWNHDTLNWDYTPKK